MQNSCYGFTRQKLAFRSIHFRIISYFMCFYTESKCNCHRRDVLHLQLCLAVDLCDCFCLQDRVAWESLLWWTHSSSLKSAANLCWPQPRRRSPKQWKSSPSVTVRLPWSSWSSLLFSSFHVIVFFCFCFFSYLPCLPGGPCYFKPNFLKPRSNIRTNTAALSV